MCLNHANFTFNVTLRIIHCGRKNVAVHPCFIYFQINPFEKKMDDNQRRQGVTTPVPSSQALFSCVCNYGNSCKLPAFPASAFVLKN